jgi:hypothetical protein
MSSMTRAQYKEAVEAANNAKSLKDNVAALEQAKVSLAESSALVRDLRALHLAHFNTSGADYLASTISELGYVTDSAKRQIKEYESRIVKLQGNVEVEDDEF